MKWRLFCGVLGLALAVMAAGTWLRPTPVYARTATRDLPLIDQRLQTGTDITKFKAAAGTTRGQINLSWNYAGKAFRSTFLVERSNNQTTWTPLTTCNLYYSTKSPSYSCSDTKLTSSRLYYYRVCIPATGVKTCPKTSATTSLKAP